MLTEGFEYGYAAHQEVEWCIRREGAWNMLCGRRCGFVPVAQPERPDPLHQECLDAYAALVQADRTESAEVGVCPVCDAEVPLDGGLIGQHGGCVGVNLRPKGGRS